MGASVKYFPSSYLQTFSDISAYTDQKAPRIDQDSYYVVHNECVKLWSDDSCIIFLKLSSGFEDNF